MDPSILAILALLVSDPKVPCQRLDLGLTQATVLTTVVCQFPHAASVDPLATPQKAPESGHHERGEDGP